MLLVTDDDQLTCYFKINMAYLVLGDAHFFEFMDVRDVGINVIFLHLELRVASISC